MLFLLPFQGAGVFDVSYPRRRSRYELAVGLDSARLSAGNVPRSRELDSAESRSEI